MPDRFSASVAGKHMSCHASANLPLAIPNWVEPDDETAAATAGTNMHEILAKLSELSPKDMLAAARALEYVAQLRQTRRFKSLIEVKMQATWLDSAPYTTVDLALHTQDELHVIDWKWGVIPVEVVGNEQLLYYAACLAPLAPKAKEITVHIVQPRCDNIVSWTFDTKVLAQFILDARAAEKAIAAGSTKFGPSDHCKFCPANPHTRGAKGRPLCPAMMQLLYPQPFDEDELLNL